MSEAAIARAAAVEEWLFACWEADGSVGGVLTVLAVAPTMLRAPAPTAPRST